MLDQQPVVLAGPADDPRGLSVYGGAGNGGVGKPQRDLVPPRGQHLDLHLGLHSHHILLHGRLVADLGDQGADGRLRFGAGAGLFPGGLP